MRHRPSAAGQIAERRPVHAHAPVPEVELIEEVGIDVEHVERGGVRQPDHLHVAQQQEQVVQLVGLLAQLTFVVAVGDAVDEVADVLAERHGES